MTGEARTGTNPGSHSYGSDLAGNRTQFDGGAFGYDDANKLVSVPGQYGSNVASDGDGNLTLIPPYSGQSAPGSFAWDDFGHLSSQTGYGGYGTVQYGYDGMGHRVWSQPSNQQTNIKTFYIFDGDLLLGEVKMLPGYSGNPPMQTLVPTPTAAYTWGADGLISERINSSGTDLTNGTSLWYAFGPQGETRQLTNGSGTVVDSYTYTSYGVTVNASNNNPNPFRYGGQVGYYSDVSGGTGIILCTNRWYSPSLGRWLSKDLIGYDGGANLYAYCENDAINSIDPSGLDRTGNTFQYLFSWDYTSDFGAFLKGELNALNPWTWITTSFHMGEHLSEKCKKEGLKGVLSASKDFVIGFWEGLQFWNQPNMESSGTSFMGDVLLVTPLIKKIPNKTPLVFEGPYGKSFSNMTFINVDWNGQSIFRCDIGELPLKRKYLNQKLAGKVRPHYHWRGPSPGHSGGRHRPFETKETDTHWSDRWIAK